MNNLRETGKKILGEPEFEGNVEFDRPLAPLTTFKIGGPAPLLVEPKSENSLLAALKILAGEGVPFFLMGGGSNLLVSDAGFDRAVIRTTRMNAISLFREGDRAVIRAEAGASWGQVTRLCRENFIYGFGPFCGLPGTLGGAARMNSSCFGLSVADVLSSARFIDYASLEFLRYEHDSADWGYKKSPLAGSGMIITSLELHGKFLEPCRESGEEIECACRAALEGRKARGHYKFPCAGSVFKNGEDFGCSAGELIDRAGLKGASSGGAQIAPWHGNIIVNTGGATCADVAALIELARDAVREKFGFELEEEIVRCGI